MGATGALRAAALVLALAALCVRSDSVRSINDHTSPAWYNNAKFGIIVTWGTFSVPAYAPLSGISADILRQHGWSYFFKNNPYAAWYANSIKISGTDAQKHHEQTYGAGYPYENFRAQFVQASAAAEPQDWADLILAAGAKYGVMVAKHHEGYCLWPSTVVHPKCTDCYSKRDFVGEFATAVRSRGLQLGIYYSAGYDWAVNNYTFSGFLDLDLGIPESNAYTDYVDAQWRELVSVYKPSILWNDMSSPIGWNKEGFVLNYYDAFPNGTINDRFSDFLQDTKISLFHHDFVTPEYYSETDTTSYKWEMTRGLGYSYGYNQLENNGSTLLTVDDMVLTLIDVVSKNGNLLLNIGPMSDGSIPPEQRLRLLGVGRWLSGNGVAIYNTVPWTKSTGTVYNSTLGVRFLLSETAPSNNNTNVAVSTEPFNEAAATTTLYACVLGHVTAATASYVEGDDLVVVFENIVAANVTATKVDILAGPYNVAIAQLAQGLAVYVPYALVTSSAYCFGMTPSPALSSS